MSDHFSGPRTLANPSCDICDLYAFRSPERTGRLVLVVNVFAVPNWVRVWEINRLSEVAVGRPTRRGPIASGRGRRHLL
jgi:Domain of unknown function (DUF4331)